MKTPKSKEVLSGDFDRVMEYGLKPHQAEITKILHRGAAAGVVFEPWGIVETLTELDWAGESVFPVSDSFRRKQAQLLRNPGDSDDEATFRWLNADKSFRPGRIFLFAHDAITIIAITEDFCEPLWRIRSSVPSFH
jgi:hypothetical protein